MCDGVRRGDFPAGTFQSVVGKQNISANVKLREQRLCVCKDTAKPASCVHSILSAFGGFIFISSMLSKRQQFLFSCCSSIRRSGSR